MINAKEFDLNRLSDDDFQKKFKDYNPEKIKNVLIIGNGFDIATGLCTKYSDFVKFIVYCLLLRKSSVKDIDTLLEEIKKREKEKESDYDVMSIVKLAEVKLAEESEEGKLLEKICNFTSSSFFKKFLCKIIDVEDVDFLDGDFSYQHIEEHKTSSQKDSLEDLVYKFFNNKQQDKYVELFFNIFERVNLLINKAVYKGWTDVESFIAATLVDDKKLEQKFDINQEDKIPFSEIEDYFDGLDKFGEMFSNYLHLMNDYFSQKPLSGQNISLFWKSINLFCLASLRSKYGDDLFTNINIEQEDLILNYNYTEMCQKIVSCLKKYNKQPVVIHVNGELKQQKSNVVFGYSFAPTVDINGYLYNFEKTAQRDYKFIHSEKFDLRDELNDYFNLFIYGFACSESDRDTVRRIFLTPDGQLNPKMLRTIIVCYDSKEFLSIRARLVNILGNDNFGKLIENANANLPQSIFFSVLDTKKNPIERVYR